MLLMAHIASTAGPSVLHAAWRDAATVVMSNLVIPQPIMRTIPMRQYTGFLGHVGMPLRNREGGPLIGYRLLN